MTSGCPYIYDSKGICGDGAGYVYPSLQTPIWRSISVDVPRSRQNPAVSETRLYGVFVSGGHYKTLFCTDIHFPTARRRFLVVLYSDQKNMLPPIIGDKYLLPVKRSTWSMRLHCRGVDEFTVGLSHPGGG
jgi:hypothetical protein